LFASQRSVPWIGNIMASRWAYEGLAVVQFMENEYERLFYAQDQRMKTANWKKDLWVKELQYIVGDVRRALETDKPLDALAVDLELLRTELGMEMHTLQGFAVAGVEKLTPAAVDQEVLDRVDESLAVLVRHYRAAYKDAEGEKDRLVTEMTDNPEARANYFALIDGYRNESLAEFVTNKNDVNVIVRYGGRFVRKSDPIYMEPERGGLFSAHFYAPMKWVLGCRVPTFWANLLVLWGMSALLALALWLEVFPKLGRLFKRG
jgi:hypothetical protein